MPSALLIGLVFVPSLIFVFVTLATFYGAERAYISISWLPLVFMLTIWLFIQMMRFQGLSEHWWRELADTIYWATAIQAGLGVGLVVRAFWRRKVVIGVSVATLVSASPLFVRLIP